MEDKFPKDLLKTCNIEALSRKDCPQIQLLRGKTGWLIRDTTYLVRFWDFAQEDYILARRQNSSHLVEVFFEKAWDVFCTLDPYVSTEACTKPYKWAEEVLVVE